MVLVMVHLGMDLVVVYLNGSYCDALLESIVAYLNGSCDGLPKWSLWWFT